MIGLAAALVNRLSTSDVLQRKLAVYERVPAIFTATRIPENCGYPYVWTPGEYSSVDDAVKNARLSEIHRDVSVYTLDEGSDALVEELAWAIRNVLHKAPLRLGADENVVLNAAPPIVAPTGDGVLGRLVQLRFVISEG